MSEDTGGRPASLRHFAAGTLIFGFALALRCFRLDFGLRNQPDYDESIFVQNALDMLSRGDWDHRFYEYPGLLLWIFRVILSAGARNADAYWVCRVAVAVASAASAFLLFHFAAKWISFRAGIFAGLLLALSPLGIETAHMIRPDAVIAPLLMLALGLISPRIGRPQVGAAFAVATIALAIKFSAALVFLPLAIAAWLHGARWLRLVLLGAASFLLFCVLSPYTLLGGAGSLQGMQVQLAYHYDHADPIPVYAHVGGFLSQTLPEGLPMAALALALWGAFLGAREKSRWALPWILMIVVWIGVFSTTGVRFGRFAVPVLGAICLFSAVAYERVATRFPWLAPFLGGALVLLNGLGSAAYLTAIAQASTFDRALDWAGQRPASERIGTSVLEIGVQDPNGRELVPLPGFRGEPFLISQFDSIIVRDRKGVLPGCRVSSQIVPQTVHAGFGLEIFQCPASAAYAALDLGGARILSSAPDRDARLIDGEVSTRWGADGANATIRVEWPQPESPAGLSFLYGATAPERDYTVRVLDDVGEIHIESIRAALAQQRFKNLGLSQVWVWPARGTRSLVIEVSGPAPLRIGEMRVLGRSDPNDVAKIDAPNGGKKP